MHTNVSVDISRVGYVPLHGSSDTERMLALFSPANPFTAVALYLLDRWWTADDILKTSDLARDGAVEVETVGERIVLYSLNRVIYRAREINSKEELPFLCHGENDYAKIYWNNGEAVGFYSVKTSGSLYNYFSTRRYELPVMDSIFVRKRHRGNGFGLHMLEDFVLSFHDDCVGLRYPLTKAMYKMCEKYLGQYPGDTGLLWEVEGVGGPNQRFNIASKVQTMDLRALPTSLFETLHEVTSETKKGVTKETIATQIKEAESMAYTVEIVEDVSVCSATKDTGDKSVATRSRSSGRNQTKKADKISERQSKKVIRVEDIEAEPPEEHVSGKQKTAAFSDFVMTEGTYSIVTEEKEKDDVAIAVEESAGVNTTLTPQEVEDAPALAAEECQDREDLMDACCDSHSGIENVSERQGVEEVSHEKVNAVEELNMTIDEKFVEKANSLTEGSDEDHDESTVVPLRGRCKTAPEEINQYSHVEPGRMVNETEGERSAEELSFAGKCDASKAGEEEKALTAVDLEGRNEVQEDENTKGTAEAVTVAVDNNEKDADNVTQELDTASVALEKDKPDEYHSVLPEKEASQEKGIELHKLQKATVILLDLKTTHHQLSVKEVEKTLAPRECAELQNQETKLEAKEENDLSSSVGEDPKPEKSETVSEENRTEESISTIYTPTETDTEKIKDGISEKQNEENIVKIEEVPVIEIRVPRSRRRKVETRCKTTSSPKNYLAEDKDGIPVKEFNEAGVIMMEEETSAVTKDTEQGKQSANAGTSVNIKEGIVEMMTTMEEYSVVMTASSDDLLQAKNPVAKNPVEEIELTAAPQQSVEVVSKTLALKSVTVVLLDHIVQEETSAKNGDKHEEQTHKGTLTENYFAESSVGKDTEQEDLVMEDCTEETKVQVIGHKGKVEEADELIQDNQQMYHQEGSLEDKNVDLQMQTSELKTDTVIRDCVLEQEDIQHGEKGECEATEPEVAAANTPYEGSTLNDPTQESMKTQGSGEPEQTQSVLATIASGDNVQETQVEEFTFTVDQSSEGMSSVKKRADIGKLEVEVERVLDKRGKSVPANTQHKSKIACKWHQSEGEEEETASQEEIRAAQTAQLLEEAEDKGGNRGTGERDEEEAVTQRGENTDPQVEMEKEESIAHPEKQEEGQTCIMEMEETDERPTIIEEEEVADPATETGDLRKRRKSASITTQPRSKISRTNHQSDREVKALEDRGGILGEDQECEEKKGDQTEEEETQVSEFEHAVIEEESLLGEDSVLAQQETPFTTGVLRSKTKLIQRSGTSTDLVESEIQPQDIETKTLIQLTDDTPENRDGITNEQLLTSVTTEDQTEGTPKMFDDSVIHMAIEDAEIEETETPPESHKDTATCAEMCENVKSGKKRISDKTENILKPKRNSLRKRPRVDYAENDEMGEDEMKSDKEKKNSNESKGYMEESTSTGNERQEDLKKEERVEPVENLGADTQNSGSDDEEEGVAHENEPSASDDIEQTVEKRLLRSRTISSIAIKPHSESRCHTATLDRCEGSSSDKGYGKSPPSPQRSHLRKKTSYKLTPARRSARHSRV
ncbi:titin-like isoform X2 [Phycodurus eques]|uniref:titin-like isoform X2 n=1 Tax=Phycodurus eques TaxID=693459 RepID=UPI002ACD21EF|nr:titin-like isoform X2 [Phycodurus eques]